jgi:hypothetical protein
MTAAPRFWSERGQAILEFTLVAPLLLIICLGVVEVGYSLLEQQVVTRMSREGSNLISREITIADAAQALRSMSSRPVNFNDGSSRVIFSVVKRGATSGTVNYDKLFMYQRAEFGTYAASSKIQFGGGSFPAPEYEAANGDTNAALRTTNVPNNLIPVPGGLLYITEIFTRHEMITPFNNFGFSLPQQLYSIAYF